MLSAEHNFNPHVVLVAGGGAYVERSTTLLHLIGRGLREQGIGYTAIDGLYLDGENVETVKPTSIQQEQTQSVVDKLPEETPVLIMAHCLGSVAAVNATEKLATSGRPIGLVSIAPPLPSPGDTLMQPQSQAKRAEGDTVMQIARFEEPVDVLNRDSIARGAASIDPRYLREFRAASDTGSRLRLLVESGSALVFAAEKDWNTQSPVVVEGWRQEWIATLPPERSRLLRDSAVIIPDVGHGFYPSIPKSPTSWQEMIDAQTSQGAHMVGAGLGLLRAQAQRS